MCDNVVLANVGNVCVYDKLCVNELCVCVTMCYVKELCVCVTMLCCQCVRDKLCVKELHVTMSCWQCVCV